MFKLTAAACLVLWVYLGYQPDGPPFAYAAISSYFASLLVMCHIDKRMK